MWTGLRSVVVWMVLMEGGPVVEAFIGSHNRITSHHSHKDHRPNHARGLDIKIRGRVLVQMAGDLDFEYIPPPHHSQNEKDEPLLPSVFPKGTPSGLRGEAVRSALLSDRGICMDLSNHNSNHNHHEHLATGVLQVKGKGTASFLQSKFSQSFRKPKNNDVKKGTVQETCLLTARGRTLDLLQVLYFPKPLSLQENHNDNTNDVYNNDDDDDDEAWIVTSPGHSGQALFDRLNPLIFPLDRVTLTNRSAPPNDTTTTTTTRQFVLAASTLQTAQSIVTTQVLPMLQFSSSSTKRAFLFPTHKNECVMVPLEQGGTLVVMEHTFLPTCACRGYTFIFANAPTTAEADKLWAHLVSEENYEGPVELGPLEWETLRIESGRPGYNSEMMGDGAPTTTTSSFFNKNKNKKDTEEKDEMDASVTAVVGVKANPLELHLNAAVDFDKGCYQGQEGVASVVKNRLGPPRALYSVMFHDDENLFDHQTESTKRYGKAFTENKTRMPQVGDELCVLGSNESIRVGVLTSVAENGGTGEPTTVALALVRRPSGILSKMKELDLEVGFISDHDDDPLWDSNSNVELPKRGDNGSSGILDPPLIDPLDGLEVIIKGSYTMGTIRIIPSRRWTRGQNMFDQTVQSSNINLDSDDDNHNGSTMGFIDVKSSEQAAAVVVSPADEEEELKKAQEEAAQAAMAAEAAAADAQRKADKMKLLQKRAAEAMARRKKT